LICLLLLLLLLLLLRRRLRLLISKKNRRSREQAFVEYAAADTRLWALRSLPLPFIFLPFAALLLLLQLLVSKKSRRSREHAFVEYASACADLCLSCHFRSRCTAAAVADQQEDPPQPRAGLCRVCLSMC
jgi:hypothetical protein